MHESSCYLSHMLSLSWQWTRWDGRIIHNSLYNFFTWQTTTKKNIDLTENDKHFKTQKHTTTFSYFSYTSPPSMIAGISSNTWLALSICSSYLPDFSCCIDLVQLVQQCSFMKSSKHETYSISRGYLDMWFKKNIRIIYRKRFKYQMYIMFNIKTYVIQGLTAARTCPNPPTTWWFLCCEALS